MLEVNISCPNVEDRGQVFACDPLASSRVIGAVRRAADPAQPVFAKLSPDVTDIALHRPRLRRRRRRRVLADQHAARHGDRHRHAAPVLGGVTGGLSGPAIRPVAVRCVWQVQQALPPLPILGMGGIRSPAWMRCSSSSPAPPRSRSAPRCSATRPRRCGCSPNSSRRWTSAASPRSPTPSAFAQLDRDQRPAEVGVCA